LQPGDGVVLCSDGITEAENAEKEFYGMERLCGVVSAHWAESAEAIKDAVVSDVRAFIGQQAVYDDLTLVVVKQKQDIRRGKTMNHKRCFLLVLVVLLAVLAATACGKKEPEIPVVAFFTIASTPASDIFKSTMAGLGYVEGESVTYVVRDAGGDANALPQVAQELVDAKPDVIVTTSVKDAQAILAITEDIPLVVAAGDHIEEGLVDSFRDHGRNLTGVASNLPTDLQLELLLTVAPDSERIFVPHNPELSFELYNLGRAKEAAADLGVELVVGEAHTDDEVAEMLEKNFPADIDGIFILSNRIATFPGDDENFIPFAIDHDLPLVVNHVTSVANGALMSYTWDIVELSTQMSRLTDKVLTGTPISDLPIERPEYYLTINLRTAEAIGIEIPDDVLERAHEIIR